MPGRLRTSFRSGNLAEDLGLLLLKGMAAVAEVARTEDVGLDAVATLLRRDADGNCYAEDSFLVQLKAESVTTIEYEDHELAWFLGQTQPMFIGHVSLARSEISLYPTLHVNQAVLSLNAKKVSIHFGASELPPFYRGQEWAPWGGDEDWGARVWLGPPILTWTLSELPDHNWATRSYETLKRFLVVARRELELLSFGQSSVLAWATNETGSIRSHTGIAKSDPNDLPELLQRSAPALRALIFQASSIPGEPGDSLMIPLLTLAAEFKKRGVEIDPDDFFGKCFFALKSNAQKA
jgi:hypothetical protein